MIDLRSDTATRPTDGMRAAIAAAAVGDEQKREDPSVTELQERVASLLGQEAALFLPTATMANQIALKLHSRPGDVLLAESTSHVVIYEYGGPAVHAGLMTLGLQGSNGQVTPEQVLDAAEPSTKAADQRVALLSLENTRDSSGGRVWPLDALAAVMAAAREAGLALHLDGARLFNAAVAHRVPAAAIAGSFDTVTICLSKGLGCPLGAVLAGSADSIERAWREKHVFGGAIGGRRESSPRRASTRSSTTWSGSRRSCRAHPGRGVGGGGNPGRPRAGADELRADRRRAARPRPGRGTLRDARRRRRAVVHDPPDSGARRHAP